MHEGQKLNATFDIGHGTGNTVDHGVLQWHSQVMMPTLDTDNHTMVNFQAFLCTINYRTGTLNAW